MPRQDGESDEDEILQDVESSPGVQRQRKPAAANSFWMS